VRRSPLAALALVALAGCGGSGDGLAPAAEPERSPPLATAPAGRVVAAGHRPEGLAFDPRTGRLDRVALTASRRIAVLSVRERALELFDAQGRRSLGRIHVGIGPTHVVARGERLFVVDTRGDGLIEVLTDPLRVHRRTHLRGAPYGIAFDPVRKRFWVTLTASNRVAELTDRRVLRTFPTVRQPNSVAVDPDSGRVFVASRRDGTLQLLDPPPYRG
jgi:DNA-binding beta-propeller fold protein YncE